MMSLRNIYRQPSSAFITYSQRRRCHAIRKYVSKMHQNMIRSFPKEANTFCKSQKLMLYNDIIQHCHPGVYHIMPLGQRALEKLIRVIDQELESIGAQKISMPSLAPASLWKTSGRWEQAGPELFKLQDRHNKDYCLSPTHEELVTDLVAQHGLTYNRLPLKFYQISRKFRDEMHPRYGLLRGREFDMKDLYTFDISEEAAEITYQEVCEVYEKIFNRLGLKFKKVIGATGNIGGKLSHEFLLPSSIGEDNIKVCRSCNYGINVEVEGSSKDTTFHDGKCPNCEEDIETMTAIEVGHSFLLGTKYSQAFNANYRNVSNTDTILQMGCYGLGVTRILAAGIEVLSEEEEIRWPQLLAPYQICIIPQMKGYMDQKFMEISDNLYDQLMKVPGLCGEVVIDDRTAKTVGKRMYSAERTGYPYIIVIGKSALESDPKLELRNVYKKKTDYLPKDEIIARLSRIQTI